METLSVCCSCGWRQNGCWKFDGCAARSASNLAVRRDVMGRRTVFSSLGVPASVAATVVACGTRLDLSWRSATDFYVAQVHINLGTKLMQVGRHDVKVVCPNHHHTTSLPPLSSLPFPTSPLPTVLFTPFQEKFTSPRTPEQAAASPSRMSSQKHSGKTHFVFCFFWVLRRKRRGFSQTRAHYQCWCVYDLKNQTKGDAETIQHHLSTHTLRKTSKC